MIFINKNKNKMKIIIKESQLRKLINEVGGYDYEFLMGRHAGDVQGILSKVILENSVIIKNFLDQFNSGNLTKENYLAFAENIGNKVSEDLFRINSLVDEIYIDRDFKKSIKNYGDALQILQNELRLIYNDGIGIGLEMTQDELATKILSSLRKLSRVLDPLVGLFFDVRNRYMGRLGLS